mgnify:CR=1 FL=1
MKNFTNELSFVLKPSALPNAGVGIFATHDIKVGTKLAINKEGGESRVMEAKDIPEDLKHFGIALPNGKRKVPKEFNHLWIVWYLNHSDTPNIELRLPENNYYAIEDIHRGEELLTNYNKFNEPEGSKESYYANK